MIPLGEAVFVWRVLRLVLTCTCLRRAWHEALSCPVWIDSHVYMSGFRTDLYRYHRVVAIHSLVFGLETCNPLLLLLHLNSCHHFTNRIINDVTPCGVHNHRKVNNV